MKNTRLSKENRALILKLYSEKKPVKEIAATVGVSEGMISVIARKAGIGRNKIARKRRSKPLRSAKRIPSPGVGMRVITELMTSPGLNNDQRVKMAIAYLNEL